MRTSALRSWTRIPWRSLPLEAGFFDQPTGWDFERAIGHIVAGNIGEGFLEVGELPVLNNRVFEKRTSVGALERIGGAFRGGLDDGVANGLRVNRVMPCVAKYLLDSSIKRRLRR